MSAEKAVAVVLRAVDFSESSSVVTLFTREFGKLSALAKGARRPKGPFESALDLLALCRVVFLRKSPGTLDLLTEAKLERRFRPAAGELPRLYAAYYIAELLTDLTDEHDPHPELFDLAEETLLTLARVQRGSPAAWILRFELGLLRVLGHLPSLGACAECGESPEPAARVTFSLAAGGVLCAKCRAGQRQLISVHVATPATLDLFAKSSDAAAPRGTSDDWRDWTVPAAQRGEIRGIMNQYLANLLGKRPRLHDYLTLVTH